MIDYPNRRVPFLFLTSEELRNSQLNTGVTSALALPTGVRIGNDVVYPIAEVDAWLWDHPLLDERFVPPEHVAMTALVPTGDALGIEVALTAAQFYILMRASTVERVSVSNLLERISNDSDFMAFLISGQEC